jgi:peptide/nickel transport system permease protein
MSRPEVELTQATADAATTPALDPGMGLVAGSRARGFLPGRVIIRETLRVPRARVGAAIVLIVAIVAVFGPLAAPHSATQLVSFPFATPRAGLPLGADYLGRDVLSRWLSGGLNILVVGLLATVLATVVATTVGLTAGYWGGALDEVLMRSLDTLLAFPAIVLALLAVSILGPKTWLIILAVAATHVPQTARVVRAAAVQLRGREFITYAETLGVKRWRLLVSELLPNITAPLAVEFGLRMTYSVGTVASLAFLGFGQQPPAANWGLMINENRSGLTVQPWAVVLPVVSIALLTIGTNLLTDGIASAAAGIGRTVDAGGQVE